MTAEEAPGEAAASPGGDLGGLVDGRRGGPARVIDWLRRNLFSSVTNTLLTLLVLVLLWLVVPPFFDWAIKNATIAGSSRADCTGDGACWVFIKLRLHTFFWGHYPDEELWRLVVGRRVADRIRRAGHARSCTASRALRPPAADFVPGAGWRPAGRRRRWVALRGHQSVGRIDALRHHLLRDGGGRPSARHPAGSRPPFPAAGDKDLLDRIHRAVAWRTSADGSIHVGRHGAAIPALRRQRRSPHPGHGGIHPVQRRLYGRDRARRSARCSGGAGGGGLFRSA